MKLALMFMAMTLSTIATVRAQSRAALVLARVCVHEAGFDADRTGDCDGIYAVLKRVGRGDVVRGAYKYSRRLMSGITSRPWVLYLGSLLVPKLWPSHLDWDQYKQQWSRMLLHATRLVSHKTLPRCAPDHWGMRYGVDMARALRAGWDRVTCGDSKNAFWLKRVRHDSR